MSLWVRTSLRIITDIIRCIPGLFTTDTGVLSGWPRQRHSSGRRKVRLANGRAAAKRQRVQVRPAKGSGERRKRRSS